MVKMALKKEKYVGAALIIIGLILAVGAQVEMNKLTHARVWGATHYTIISQCPVFLIQYQMMGVGLFSAGLTILLYSWIITHMKQAPYIPEVINQTSRDPSRLI